MTLGERLRILRETKGLKQNEAALLLDINNVNLNRYETDKHEPDFNTLARLASFYSVSSDYLLGLTDNPKANVKEAMATYPDHSDAKTIITEIENPVVFNAINRQTPDPALSLLTQARKSYGESPILGSVSAGVPLAQQQDILGYWPLPPGLTFPEYFWLRVNGDSMEPLIPDGSYVLIRQAVECQNGAICCLNIENETTIKRIFRYDGRIELVPENPRHQRSVFHAGTITISGVYAGHFVPPTNGNGK
jgi:SOS-response transcriptional repressor LexA